MQYRFRMARQATWSVCMSDCSQSSMSLRSDFYLIIILVVSFETITYFYLVIRNNTLYPHQFYRYFDPSNKTESSCSLQFHIYVLLTYNFYLQLLLYLKIRIIINKVMWVYIIFLLYFHHDYYISSICLKINKAFKK